MAAPASGRSAATSGMSWRRFSDGCGRADGLELVASSAEPTDREPAEVERDAVLRLPRFTSGGVEKSVATSTPCFAARERVSR
jgi:hypothetical protein